MTRRLGGLSDVDPRSAPLPHGTEVTTRVDRVHGERRVPMGAIGRVMRTGGDAVDVQIVGVGTLSFARDEILPRRVGQALYATRRAAAWEALGSCIVIDAVVGSRAWGLAGPSSDEDKRGVFVHPLEWTAGIIPAPEDLVSSDGSSTYWSFEKTVRQALRADPNTLELLFVDSATPLDPIGAWLLQARDAFVSRDIYSTFVRYALSQLRRLEQSSRLAEHRFHVLQWLREDETLGLDDVAARLGTISPRAETTAENRTLAAKEWVKELYRSLFDQGLIPTKDFGALRAFAAGAARDLELPRELRPKNAYNLLRLVFVARAWLSTGSAKLRMEGDEQRELLAIKEGRTPLDAVLARADELLPELERARDSSPLPERPDLVRADALLKRVRQEVARRSVLSEAGPLGRDAPLAPRPVEPPPDEGAPA